MNPKTGQLSTAGSSTRLLEITVISAEDLRVRGKMINSSVFAVVSAEYGPGNARTNIDRDGGSYPLWNEKILLDMPLQARYMTVEVRRRTSLSEEGQPIGAATIPVSDFIGGYGPEGHLHCLSYRLRDAGGDRNGIINMSVRVKTSQANEYSTKPPQTNGCSTSSSSQAYMPYSTSSHTNGCSTSSSSSQPGIGIPVGQSGGGGDGTVTGVPMWYACRS